MHKKYISMFRGYSIKRTFPPKMSQFIFILASTLRQFLCICSTVNKAQVTMYGTLHCGQSLATTWITKRGNIISNIYITKRSGKICRWNILWTCLFPVHFLTRSFKIWFSSTLDTKWERRAWFLFLACDTILTFPYQVTGKISHVWSYKNVRILLFMLCWFFELTKERT
jgi:hypothetical protein